MKPIVSVRLGQDLNVRLIALARLKRRSKSELVRQAIRRLLDDEEDLEMVERALSDRHPAKTLRQLRRQLGLGR